MFFSPLKQFPITRIIPITFFFFNFCNSFLYLISESKLKQILSNLKNGIVNKKVKVKVKKENSKCIKSEKWIKIKGKSWNFKVSDRLFFEIQKPSNCLDYQKISTNLIILDYLPFLSITPVISDQKRPLYVVLKDSVKLQVKRDLFDCLVHTSNKPYHWSR